MKSYVDYSLAVYGSILADAATRWPAIKGSLDKDLSYLRRAVEDRGLSFLTITLPELGKVIDQCLDWGELTGPFPRGIPVSKRRPKIFGGLFDLVFNEDGLLRDDVDYSAVLFLRTLFQCVKKLRMEYSPSSLSETLKEFFEIEERLPPSWPATWDDDVPVWQAREGHPLWGLPPDLDIDPLFGAFGTPGYTLPWHDLRWLCQRFTAELGVVDWWSILPKHGRGAVSEKGWKSKYDFPSWPRKLDLFFPFDWFGSGRLDTDSFPSSREESSRLIAVPKSQKGPRLICAEPLAHQWIQQGIWKWIEDRLPTTLVGRSVTFRSQELSRRAALEASLSGDYATIDLSSASDRLSTRLVEYVFQGSSLLDGMHACRTRTLRQDLSSEFQNTLKLRKFSTMGSALTFPVQSIVFTLLSVWALRLSEGRSDDKAEIPLRRDFDRVRVFGDDIIIPSDAEFAVKLVLHECGLKVNASKSFNGSNFRESCGCDAFKGVDVTPPRCLEPYDGSPSSMATNIETSNNFHRSGFWKTADMLVSTVPPAERKLLAVYGGDEGSLGLFSFVGTYLDHLPSGWDSDLQREYSVALGITSKVSKVQGGDYSGLTQYFTERPDPGLPWKSGQPGKVRLRKRRTRVYTSS